MFSQILLHPALQKTFSPFHPALRIMFSSLFLSFIAEIGKMHKTLGCKYKKGFVEVQLL